MTTPRPRPPVRDLMAELEASIARARADRAKTPPTPPPTEDDAR